jgi:hypothetical protein
MDNPVNRVIKILVKMLYNGEITREQYEKACKDVRK